MLIRPGNSKLGEVPCFSLPAVETCPGSTETCRTICYATNGFFRMRNVQNAHTRNWIASKRPDFARKMIEEIRQMRLEVMRVHVSGDFYSVGYINKWIQIAKTLPNVRFYAYTRSWRKAKLRPALLRLAALENFVIWWSCDKDTNTESGRPPEEHGTRAAFLQVAHGETVPAYADLVLRAKQDTVAKTINGRPVCPAENGTEPKGHCAQCKRCWTRRASRRKASAVLQ